jgi:hypothetical protein
MGRIGIFQSVGKSFVYCGEQSMGPAVENLRSFIAEKAVNVIKA